MQKRIVPLLATLAAQILLAGSIGAAATASMSRQAEITVIEIPLRAEISQTSCIRTDPEPYPTAACTVPLDDGLQRYTEEMCDLYDVPLELAYAVMQVESQYTVDATSTTGDYGLMQINSINAEWLESELGITDLLDARQNITAGCYILGQHLEQYEGDINHALMAYNLGTGGAAKAWNAGTRSTAYTDKVWKAMIELLEAERDVS
jgi:soluble lytic murein transglycosylase-like protein|nr:MAG TPA: hypothetical protein [Caudoviricetes sp.]